MNRLRGKRSASVVRGLRGKYVAAVAAVLISLGAVAVAAASARNDHLEGAASAAYLGSGGSHHSASSHRGSGRGAQALQRIADLPAGLAPAVTKALGASASPSRGTHRSRSSDPQQKLQGPAQFGFSVSLSPDGSLALVGAPVADSPQGAVFVFARVGGAWIFQQKLQVTHPIQFGLLRFGSSVSLSSDGRTALIGAQGSNPAIGGEDTAYVFVRGSFGGFTLQQQLLDPAGRFSGNGFGYSVSLSSDGRTALVGAPGGRATYVFVRGFFGGWIPRQRLQANDGAAIGGSVSLSSDGSTALIGANEAAYVFARGFFGGFTQQQKLQPNDGAAGEFGSSVSLSGDGRTALIGAPSTDNLLGAAYVFARGFIGGFTQQQKLQASDSAAGDLLGWSVSLDRTGSRALIGATGKDSDTGAAYVFARPSAGGFTQQQELQAADRAANDPFGWSVALSSDGRVALIGAPFKDAAYVFTGLDSVMGN
jgi:phage gpG-like protein